jgi:7,8-dihydropterin-6-yl-methyl-4-(beta-D-ribofuranosyl)aminobenzene 5'-phosphate synthase
VIGGLHLDASRPELLERTRERLGRQGVESLYACHCTDMKSRIALARACEVEEAGVGTVLEFP